MMSFTIRSLLIFCLFSFPSLADDRLPLKEGRYTVEGTQCEAVDNINTALLSNQHISIAESRCEFSEPTLIGDGEYSLKATCAQNDPAKRFLAVLHLKTQRAVRVVRMLPGREIEAINFFYARRAVFHWAKHCPQPDRYIATFYFALIYCSPFG